jgi:hypothetical protein
MKKKTLHVTLTVASAAPPPRDYFQPPPNLGTLKLQIGKPPKRKKK